MWLTRSSPQPEARKPGFDWLALQSAGKARDVIFKRRSVSQWFNYVNLFNFCIQLLWEVLHFNQAFKAEWKIKLDLIHRRNGLWRKKVYFEVQLNPIFRHFLWFFFQSEKTFNCKCSAKILTANPNNPVFRMYVLIYSLKAFHVCCSG